MSPRTSMNGQAGDGRLRFLKAFFALALLGLAGRLVDLALEPDAVSRVAAAPVAEPWTAGGRIEVVDRNGVLLATDYPKVSVFADPAEILDPTRAARRLGEVLADVDPGTLAAALRRSTRFVWVKRHISEDEQRAVMRLGLPGIKLRTERHRIYPQGRLVSHALGFVGIENQGLAGLERSLEDRMRGSGAGAAPLRLTIDVRVQEIVRSVLAQARSRFQAKGASGLVLEIGSGQVIGMVSLPDFDPHRVDRAAADARFNRNTQGTYELGSVFKLFTVAMALDAGIVDISGGLDASQPFEFGRHRIRDFHAKRRWLSVPEIIAFSSNIGAARMADALGAEAQRAYFQDLALLDRHGIRLPEVGRPQIPVPWRPINTITASYGHGLAVSPLQVADALAALLCSAPARPAHLLLDAPPAAREAAVVRPEVSMMLRWLMWLVVSEGTGKLAHVDGYLVGGKTGSADQAGPSGYRDGRLLSSFIGAFPIDRPRYVVLVTLDRPQGDAATHQQAHGGWTAAPAVGRIIARIGPLLGIEPRADQAEPWFRARLVEDRAYSPRLGRDEPSFKIAKGATWDAIWPGEDRCGCPPC
ncbi:MAG TPA: penicillin-binding protein 2 [Geminicoccaceae bacterium]